VSSEAASQPSAQTEPVLEARGVSKSFPGVQALDAVELRLRPGEIHALIGENGAGKSTLIKIVTGVYRPDEGELQVDRESVGFHSPRDALRAGISVVHQERNLVPQLSVAENIVLEKLPTRRFWTVDYRRAQEEAERWMDVIGLRVSPHAFVADLSVAQIQLVEIAKALSLESHILLLDEPTAAITLHEVDFLFNVLRGLSRRGVAILFVSHKLEEVDELCERVTVLRDGRNTALDRPLADIERGQLVSLMIGRAEVIKELPPRPRERGRPVLELRHVWTASGCQDVNLAVHDGEIVGIYGLVGAGRTEIAKAVVGAGEVTAGEIRVNGQRARIRSVGDALARHRIGYVSEDRKEEGLILLHSVVRNVSITIWRRLRELAFLIRGSRERDAVLPYVERLEIKTPSLDQAVGNLSGGNQQKVSLGKWLAADVRLLIIDEPTVGIDVKTKQYIHELIWELAGQGRSILLISSDMPEIIRLADRILVMRDKRVVGEFANSHRYDEMSERIMGLLT
jgi:ribose transport system ATP-binding protein